MKYLILAMALISQTALARTIIEERELSPKVKYTKYSEGWIFKDYYAEVSHPTCEIYVPTGTSRVILNGLVEYGYFPVETPLAIPLNDYMYLSDLRYESFQNRYGCAQTNISFRLNFGRVPTWIPFYLMDNHVACIADKLESQGDVVSLFFTEQMPRCVRAQ